MNIRPVMGVSQPLNNSQPLTKAKPYNNSQPLNSDTVSFTGGTVVTTTKIGTKVFQDAARSGKKLTEVLGKKK